jgi:hypothetical protein
MAVQAFFKRGVLTVRSGNAAPDVPEYADDAVGEVTYEPAASQLLHSHENAENGNFGHADVLFGAADGLHGDHGTSILEFSVENFPSMVGGNLVYGTDASEKIDVFDGVTSGYDLIYGLGGNDSIYGLGGDDYIVGGAGADFLNGGTGYDSAAGTKTHSSATTATTRCPDCPATTSSMAGTATTSCGAVGAITRSKAEAVPTLSSAAGRGSIRPPTLTRPRA